MKKKKEKKDERKVEKRGYSWKAFFPFTKEGKKMRKASRKKKTGRKKKRFSFEPHLRKAGYEFTDDSKTKKYLFKVSVVLALVLSFYVLYSAARGERAVSDVLIFMAGYWTVFFVFILLLVSFSLMMFLDIRAYNRKKQIEAVLPDFLQLTSANISAGMPIDRALWFAVRPSFGILAKEIEEVAKATYTGKELRASLEEFTAKYDSKVLSRSINLLLEGMDAGGEMAELLNKISMNIEETNILRKEMAANVTTYAIFIGAATVAGAPFLFALSTQLLIIIKSIAGAVGGTATTGGMFSFSMNPDAVKISDFQTYSILLLLFSSFFSGAIISVIKKGNVKDGAVTIPALMIVTVVLYMIFNSVLGFFMGVFV